MSDPNANTNQPGPTGSPRPDVRPDEQPSNDTPITVDLDNDQGENIGLDEGDLSNSDNEMQSNFGAKARSSRPAPGKAKPAFENHDPTVRPEAEAKFPLRDGIEPKAAVKAIELFTAEDNDSHLGYTVCLRHIQKPPLLCIDTSVIS